MDRVIGISYIGIISDFDPEEVSSILTVPASLVILVCRIKVLQVALNH